MNERIQDLLNTAYISLNPPGVYRRYDNILPEQMETFVESLIRDNIQSLINNGYDDAANCLKEIHFGIQE